VRQASPGDLWEVLLQENVIPQVFMRIINDRSLYSPLELVKIWQELRIMEVKYITIYFRSPPQDQWRGMQES
jgi:hypothetical protein